MSPLRSQGRCEICLHGEASLEIEVTDDGRTPLRAASPGRGHGLVGMRERASLFGGSVEAGPRAEGGFRVRALLPAPSGDTRFEVAR